MNAFPIEYAAVDDGAHVAYRVSGSGDLPVLEIGSHGTVFPFDAAQGQPRWARFEERLGRFSQLIKFDHRGIGFSDTIDAPSLESWVRDAVAVLDASGCESAHVLATGQGSLAAIELAARHQNRVSSLILVNGYPRYERAPDYPAGGELDVVSTLASIAEPSRGDGDSSDIDVMAPSLSDDLEARQWWARTSRSGAGPSFMRAQWELCVTADVRPRVPDLSVPALIVGTTANQFVSIEHSRWLDAHLSGSRLCELPGPDHTTWALPGDAAIKEIEEFLTGTRSSQTGTRSLMAVLFTDIVESTARNAAAGDAKWLDLLARHDAMTDEEVKRHDGRIVKRLGDGLLAVFPLTSAAIDAASGVINRSVRSGIEVRAAVHAAEIEEVDGDVLGLGVTVAARVLDHARGGEIVTTKAVADLMIGSHYEFASRGSHELKGIPGHIELAALR